MEGSAAAAPAAGSTTATPASPGTPNGANGAQTPAPKPPAKPNAPTQGAKPRAENGQFAKGGEPKPPEQEAPPPQRFKRKLKDGDREEELDLSEDELWREVSIARAAKRRMGDLNKGLKDLEERQAQEAARREAYKQNPELLLQEMGVNVEEYAARALAAKAKRSMMSPEEVEMTTLRQEHARMKQELETHQRQAQEQQAQAAEDARWQKQQPLFEAAIKSVGLPQTPQALGLLARVGQQMEEALGEAATPELIVQETHERLSKFAEQYVFGLSPEDLSKKLGSERKKALQALWHKEWLARQKDREPVPRNEPKPPPPAETPGPKPHLTEAELDARMRASIQKHR